MKMLKTMLFIEMVVGFVGAVCGIALGAPAGAFLCGLGGTIAAVGYFRVEA